MIFDSVENIETYCDEIDPIYKAIQFVLNFDKTQPDGKYEIEGDDIFANVMTVTTTDASEKDFEAHQDHLDVQMLIEGCERHDIVLLDSEEMELTQEYDPDKDVLFVAEPDHFSTLIMKPGMFAVYGPIDGHRPCGSVEGEMKIRKVCVKIKL
ncbi:MAG: YhcH/YjgK/YiaL family protein [Phycisphaerae bacterium]|nr:YhcH/YjgK/YiaL family protein [Phycisphaerae bacterium]